MTYNVFGGTLSLTQSISSMGPAATGNESKQWEWKGSGNKDG